MQQGRRPEVLQAAIAEDATVDGLQPLRPLQRVVDTGPRQARMRKAEEGAIVEDRVRALGLQVRRDVPHGGRRQSGAPHRGRQGAAAGSDDDIDLDGCLAAKVHIRMKPTLVIAAKVPAHLETVLMQMFENGLRIDRRLAGSEHAIPHLRLLD